MLKPFFVRNFTACFLVLAALFSAASCKKSDKIYSHCEMVIPLTDDFCDSEDARFDVAYTNGTAKVALLRISFYAAAITGISGTYSAQQFGEYWLKQSGRDANLLKDGDVDFCDYIDEDIFHLASFYRSKNAYFVLLFAVDSTLESEWRPRFIEFSKGVYFTD